MAARASCAIRPAAGSRSVSPVRLNADIICPWCYVGVRRFERALAQFPGASSVEVRYRPYRVDAHALPPAVRLLPLLEKQVDGRRQRLVRYTRAIVSAVARDEGIEIAWERILRVDTSSAHRLLALAWREYGSAVQRGLVERLFEAHFTRDADELRCNLEDAQRRVNGVPTFVFNGELGMDGSQDLPTFLHALEAVGAAGTGRAYGRTRFSVAQGTDL